MNNRFKELDQRAIYAMSKLIAHWTSRAKIYEKMELQRITQMDDKLILTTKELTDAARNAGFRDVKIISLTQAPRFQNETKVLMQHFDVDYNAFPCWAKEILVAFDESDINHNENDIWFYSAIMCMK